MSDDEINIAIAEACGKKFCEHTYDNDKMFCTQCGWNPEFTTLPIEAGTMRPIPDYLNDLNAMHEAEKVLERTGKDTIQIELNLYAEILGRISRAAGNHYTFVATARQRAEAFLRCLGRWKEDAEKRAPGAIVSDGGLL